MKLKNSYIFIPKEDDTSKSTQNEDGTITFTFSVQNISSHLQEIFSIATSNIERSTLFKRDLKFEKDIDGTNELFVFEVHEVGGNYYVDATASNALEEKTVLGLEYITHEILKRGNSLNQQYYSIVSYDAASEYYCNKVLP
jgi:hypothetical protein